MHLIGCLRKDIGLRDQQGRFSRLEFKLSRHLCRPRQRPQGLAHAGKLCRMRGDKAYHFMRKSQLIQPSKRCV